MSHISAALQELTRDRRQQDIADAIGMPRTTFTQYRLAMRPPTVEIIEQMLRAFTEEEQQKLVRAYLDDETPAPWFGRVHIEFKKDQRRKTKSAGGRAEAPMPKDAAPGLAGVDDKALSAAITTLLARANEDADVRQVILDLAAIV